MVEPFAAFPSWFLRIECDRCGKVGWSTRRMHHGAEDGRLTARSVFHRRGRAVDTRYVQAVVMNDAPLPGTSPTAELLTCIEGVSSRLVRRVVLLG
jgi:hypothetical protein